MARPVPKAEIKSSPHVPSPGLQKGKKPIARIDRGLQPKKWCFSFQFWKQIDFFGLSGKDPAWFASLLIRLQEMSRETVDSLFHDSRKKDTLRYHRVNWGQTNIPIKREELDWVPEDYRLNEDEYPTPNLTGT